MSLAIAALLLLAPADGDPDLDLAAALARRGWVELAEELCGRIEKNPRSSPAARDGVPMVLAEVAIAKARIEADVLKASKELEAAVERLNRPNHEPTLDERGMIGWLHVQKAKILSAAAQEDAALRPEAVRSWDTAVNYYRASLAQLRSLAANRAVDDAILDASMELAKAQAGQARVPSINPALRKKLLEASVAAFGELLLVNDYARAERCFREMPRMRTTLKKMGYPPNEYQTSLLHQGVLALAGTLTKAGKPKEAVAACDEFLRDNPRLVRSAIGFAMTLAKADGLHALGNKDGAVALAEGVVAENPDGPAGAMARVKIADWTKGMTVTPARIMAIADGLMDRGKYREALGELRRCVEACRTDAERATHEPVAFFKRGDCFRALKQDAEAAVAYQDVFRKYPKHELAQRAAFEAVRALSRASTGERREEEQMEKLLDEIERLGLQGEVAGILKFLRAEILERKGQWKAAADLFRQVDEACPVYDDALVLGGRDYRRDAERQWEKVRGNAAAREELSKQMGTAESMLRKAAARLEPAGREKAGLRAQAYFELALINLHESIAKPAEALGFLKPCVALLPPESEMRPRLSELEIQAQLAAKDPGAAAASLDKMLTAFPDAVPTSRSCRRVAQSFESSDWGKAAKYYRAWLDRTATIPFTTAELLSVADGLYRAARSLNKLDDQTLSVMDLKGKPLADRAVWRDATLAREMLLQAKGLPAEDALAAATRLVWCSGLQADSAADWEKAKGYAEKLLQDQGLLANGKFQPAALGGKKWLLGVYLEYGHAYYQLGRSGQKFQFANGQGVFYDIVEATAPESEPWWIANYMGIRCMFERGEGGDIRRAAAALSLLEGNRPGFDGGKFGMKQRFLDLRAEVRAAEGTQR
jgi:tetratricopeptide (TPR) repeat protein